MKTVKTPSRILSEIYETIRDLYAIGVVSEATMAQFDALCLIRSPTPKEG